MGHPGLKVFEINQVKSLGCSRLEWEGELEKSPRFVLCPWNPFLPSAQLPKRVPFPFQTIPSSVLASSVSLECEMNSGRWTDHGRGDNGSRFLAAHLYQPHVEVYIANGAAYPSGENTQVWPLTEAMDNKQPLWEPRLESGYETTFTLPGSEIGSGRFPRLCSLAHWHPSPSHSFWHPSCLLLRTLGFIVCSLNKSHPDTSKHRHVSIQ